MPQVLDILGASGAVYRFQRHVSGAPLPVMAGIVLYAAPGEGRPLVVACAALETLKDALSRWDEAAAQGATKIYIRLNVGRVTRERELADIVAFTAPMI